MISNLTQKSRFSMGKSWLLNVSSSLALDLWRLSRPDLGLTTRPDQSLVTTPVPCAETTTFNHWTINLGTSPFSLSLFSGTSQNPGTLDPRSSNRNSKGFKPGCGLLSVTKNITEIFLLFQFSFFYKWYIVKNIRLIYSKRKSILISNSVFNINYRILR